MNSKRRTRAVFLSALLVFACLTAIPTASEATMIKWWQFPQMLGEPDEPGSGTTLVRIRGLSLCLNRFGAMWTLVVVPERSVRGLSR